MTRLKRLSGSTAVGFALLALTCGACSSAEQSTDGQSSAAAASRSNSVESVLVTELFARVEYRYAEFDNPAELAKSSLVELVVTGKVTGFAEGPTFLFQEEGDPVRNVLMSVAVADVAKGAMPRDSIARVVLSRAFPCRLRAGSASRHDRCAVPRACPGSFQG